MRFKRRENVNDHLLILARCFCVFFKTKYRLFSFQN